MLTLAGGPRCSGGSAMAQLLAHALAGPCGRRALLQ